MRLCNAFGVPALRDYQEEAARHIILGQSVLYDVPTGGGKTLTFYLPLFYHWKMGSPEKATDKVILVISPLNALMDSQVKDLVEKGIPAAALHSQGIKEDELFEKCGKSTRLKYRVIFASPEKALSNTFHEKILRRKAFKSHCLEVVIDEAHCMSEWGGDFRPEYGILGKLLARIGTVPMLVSTATMPLDILVDIRQKLGLPETCARVAVSNAKHNTALSIRIMQHPQDSYGDLFSLFPSTPDATFEDFPQTLIYVNSRTEAEEIQDYLRKHSPSYLPKTAFEFYHRYIDENRKKVIQNGLIGGEHRCVMATDALGM
ncbi:hypothetical protein MPER_12755, partial [Moniliophthora perniciosa FA553]